jgi:hypothetical protein
METEKSESIKYERTLQSVQAVDLRERVASRGWCLWYCWEEGVRKKGRRPPSRRTPRSTKEQERRHARIKLSFN